MEETRHVTAETHESEVWCYLYEQRHVWLLHGLYGGLDQRDGGLQVIAVPTNEQSNVFQLVVLLLGDETNQLLLPLLQDGHQPVKLVGQVLPPSPPIFLQ